MTPTFFSTEQDFRKWLKKNHTQASELLVGFYKTDSRKPSMTWSQSVDHALCFGWIDGVRKSIDKESYTIRFTPRRSTSIWSSINIKKMDVLIKAGLMTAAGLKAFSFRTETKSNIYAHEKAPSTLDPKFEKEFKKNKPAWTFFTQQAPSYKKVMIHWIMNAKQEATKLSRLEKTIKVSAEQKRMQ